MKCAWQAKSIGCRDFGLKHAGTELPFDGGGREVCHLVIGFDKQDSFFLLAEGFSGLMPALGALRKYLVLSFPLLRSICAHAGF